MIEQKAEVLNAFFTEAFTKTCLQHSQFPEILSVWTQESLPSVHRSCHIHCSVSITTDGTWNAILLLKVSSYGF